MSNIQLFDTTPQKSIEECIAEAYKSFNVPPLGGASLDGWSKMSDFQRCPYRYWALHMQTKLCTDCGLPDNANVHTCHNEDNAHPFNSVEPLIQLGPKPVSLETGALFHAALACHYIGSVPLLSRPQSNVIEKRIEYPTALELLNRVESLGGNPEICAEVTRLYIAYFNQYGNPHAEGITPLAIELPAGKEGVHTCRFDMLASIHGGTWIVEHKTASRETRDVLESWWLDGEIIGEVYGYRLSGLEKIYGPLVGVLVNVTVKTKEPKFRRIEVVIPDSLLARYAEDMSFWKASRRDLQAMRTEMQGAPWPRKLQGCIGRYDTCQLWDHCRDAEATDSGRMMSLLQQSIDNAKR